ncbi:hypothetical protein UAY_02327 [Enterococcus moraviensis ATCC BAA-383]|uniref:DUF1697 domain-containing protein n=1 Tax=Enterococcus moraviensis ATCC BAA-383 TaxID=1158609 RepID=R2QUQ9_9ENTE|nr:DUF1697 domain-containing protein [Enterococcus moraviensis]EOH99058.1 hypothetical protein UAY_02327 [Enterococcus moraviensis ATCC BAA-383]EOT71767.1 hypothetical protein I586_01574 [Enterococcus moraviensis ATCC BAA-383]
MTRYIALLRGVNVGGKNRVVMATLKARFEQHGFKDVSTYLNSGNVIFSSEGRDVLQLTEDCEKLIEAEFGLKIIVTIVSAKELLEALEQMPEWWNVDKESKHNVIFVIPPTTTEEVINSVGEAKIEYEKVAHHERVIFWSAPIKTFSRSRWSKIVGTKMYSRITIRNANTVNKLAELVQKNN